MKDLSKTEIQVNQDIIMSVPSTKQIQQIAKAVNLPENYKTISPFIDWLYIGDPVKKIQKRKKQSKKGTSLPLAILYKNELAGFCRIIDISQKHQKAELGYFVLSGFRRNGIASSILISFFVFCFTNLNLNRVELCIDPSNEASIKLAKKHDFKLEGTLRQSFFSEVTNKLIDDQIWSMLKEEYSS